MEPNGPPTPRTEDSLLLEELDKNLFRCDPAHLWRPVGARGVFGGQIIGLSLVAATNTVPRTHKVHSLHSYFLLGGDNSRAILFRVEAMRDSRSFVTRQVTAQQNGRPIFVLICSFMRPEDTPLEHQYTMPVAPAPESLPSREQMMESWIQQTPKKYHESIRERLEEPIPIDMRPCEPLKEPRQLVWMKSKTGLPADPAFHMCVAAYCSDHHLLWTTLRPHAVTGVLGMLVSLDHSMWYHSDFRADEWLLYEMESPRVSAGRGMALGRLWTRDGKLAVTIAQEGLIRANLNPEKPLTVGFGRVPPRKEQEGEPKPGKSKL
ncbi:acyl-CoA thioesterase II [Catenaria anguillulae PL171]|uniref:Acyl-CoA thioesterase II n=1 Tax=Catenaria anguillulae PL171 TaxID=765915 RepID=A0A1Y2HNR8_9FUNG|nr:acyl-CoA thioesterase II [Catenaria anguillulae PL171]